LRKYTKSARKWLKVEKELESMQKVQERAQKLRKNAKEKIYQKLRKNSTNFGSFWLELWYILAHIDGKFGLLCFELDYFLE
jgi:hypothetical protein